MKNLLLKLREQLLQSPMLLAHGLAALVLFIFSPSLLAVVIGVYLSYRVFGPYLSPRIFSTQLFRIVVGFLLYGVLLQCVVLLLWVVDRQASLQMMPAITDALLLGAMALLRGKRPDIVPVSFSNRYDITALTVAVLVSLVIVVPAIYRGTYTPSNVVRLANANVDDAWHLSSINDHLDMDRGVLTGIAHQEDLRNSARYPAGWHSFNAALIRASVPDISTGADTLTAYALTKVIWFAVLIYVVARTGMLLLARYLRKKMSWSDCLVFAVIAAYFLQVYVHTFIEGFYSFIPQVIYGIIAICLICQLRMEEADKEKTMPAFVQTFTLLFVTLIGGNLAWFFPLPAFVAFLVAMAGYYLWGREGLKSRLRLLLRETLGYIPLYVAVIAAVLIQIKLLAIESAASESITESLAAGGGVTVYNDVFYFAFGLGLAAFFIMISRSHRKDALTRNLWILFTCLLLFASAIYVYQQVKLGVDAYYYRKVIYLLLAMATPLVIAGYAYVIKSIAATADKALLYAVLLFCVLLNFVGIEPTTTKYMFFSYPQYLVGERKLNPVNELIYDHLKYGPQDTDTTRSYFFTQHSVTANVLLKSDRPISPCFQNVLATIGRGEDIRATDQVAQKECNGYTTYLVADKADAETVGKTGFTKLQVITVEQAEGREPL